VQAASYYRRPLSAPVFPAQAVVSGRDDVAVDAHTNCQRRANRTRDEASNRQLISVDWCADTPPPLGSVLRFVKLELGNQSPKLNLVTVR
jgi:hypothetical protein